MRTLAMMAVLAIAAPFRTLAEGHPLHTRPRPITRPIGPVPTDHARTSSRGGKTAAKTSAKKETRHTAGKSSTRAAKLGPHAKTHRRTQPVEESEPVLKRRVRVETRRGPMTGKIVARNVDARRLPAQPAAAPVAEEAKPLTVNDFLQAAASGEASTIGAKEVFAQGQSHPDDDVSVVVVRSPGKQAAVVRPPGGLARAAASRSTLPAGLNRSAPADLTGAPLEQAENPPAPISEVAPRAELPAARLPMSTRQELTFEVEQPVVLPGLYRNGRLVVPAPLKGTREILVHQNTMADDEGLERIQDEDDVRRLRAARLLVDFPESASLHVNAELAADRRCARVWTVRFAADIGRAYYARFHEPLQVNSAVRTVAYQLRLQRTNGNAAAIDGEAASPHLTGQAMDLAKRGMSVAQIAWMRSYLLPWMQAGKIDVEEEFQQACFHISVYRTYLPVAPTRRRVAPKSEVAQLRVEPKPSKSAPRAEELR